MIAFVVVAVLAAQTQVIAVKEGDAVPFVGVCMTNDRAAELAVSEAESEGCALKLAVTTANVATWKEAAAKAVAEGKASGPESSPSPFESSGLLIGVGVVIGVALTVGAYLLAGWTIGVAKDAAPP